MLVHPDMLMLHFAFCEVSEPVNCPFKQTRGRQQSLDLFGVSCGFAVSLLVGLRV